MVDVREVQQRIDEGEVLLNNVELLKKNDKPLPGSIKLANRIKSELKFLSKVHNGVVPLKPCHMTSTNLGSLQALLAVVHILGCKNVTAVLNSFKDSFKVPLSVDVVADGGHIWIKVVARNASALHITWTGQGQFGERSLVDAAHDYLRTAQCHPVDYQVPKVVFYFTNGVPLGLANELTEMGVLVSGDVRTISDHSSSSDDEVDHNAAQVSASTVKLTDLLRQNMNKDNCGVHPTGAISKANLDISTMLTLISNLSNGKDQYVYGLPALDEQAQHEREAKVLPRLQGFLENKTLIACETAVKHFNDIVATIGGKSERERAAILLKKLSIVSDKPSPRTLSLMTSSKLNQRAKIVFGTGDTEQAITVTSNSGFVRAALQNGVRYSVFEHEPRALTEIKEKHKPTEVG